MSHQDIADHLGLTIETVSRVITYMETSGLIARVGSS
jgi:CRP/FNR family nitrogen fixation transcriptional regulator